MEKIYIPSNMLLDLDHGLCRMLTIASNQAVDVNRINSILNKRQNPCPIEEFIIQYPILKLNGLTSDSYQWLMDNRGDMIISLSPFHEPILNIVSTAIVSGLSGEVQFVIGYDKDKENDVLESLTRDSKILSSSKISLPREHNKSINLNEFDTIFVKVLDENILRRFSNENITMKKIYVADYNFNVIQDNNGKRGIPLEYMMKFEELGCVVYTISMY